jgi:hypothetical protein
MKVARDLSQSTATAGSEPNHRDQVIAHENVWS